jgi:hypothetical protein
MNGLGKHLPPEAVQLTISRSNEPTDWFYGATTALRVNASTWFMSAPMSRPS